MASADGGKLLTSGEAAAVLGVTAETVRRWADASRIRHVRLPSGQIRFRREDLDAVLEPVDPQPTEAAS